MIGRIYPKPLHRTKELFMDAKAFALAVRRQGLSVKILLKKQLEFYMDADGRVVCLPYSESNLHQMAGVLGLNKFSFKKTHYVIPEFKRDKFRALVNVVRPGSIENVITKNKL